MNKRNFKCHQLKQVRPWLFNCKRKKYLCLYSPNSKKIVVPKMSNAIYQELLYLSGQKANFGAMEFGVPKYIGTKYKITYLKTLLYLYLLSLCLLHFGWYHLTWIDINCWKNLLNGSTAAINNWQPCYLMSSLDLFMSFFALTSS